MPFDEGTDSSACSLRPVGSARTLLIAGTMLAFLSAGCEEEASTPSADGGAPDAGSPKDAGDPTDAYTRDADVVGMDSGMDDEDASTPDQDAALPPTPDASTPVTCGACPAAMPVCLDGTCVECTNQDASRCVGATTCDTATHTCVDKYQPFELDCARLPENGTCNGGPREVLLATHASGLIAMLDPNDGHFLGYYKRNDLPIAAGTDPYWFATQGPDQCIWTVREGDGGISRWNEGALVDTIIKTGQNYVGQDDVLQDPHSIAFTDTSVYVASTYGWPNARITRYGLDGTFDKIVLDDGSVTNSLLVTRDGSLIISDSDARRVALLPADGGALVPVLGDVRPGQLAYAGNGQILVSDTTLAEKVYRVSVSDGMAKGVKPFTSSAANVRGVAPLDNGKWLICGSDAVKIAALDPEATNPSGNLATVWDDPAIEYAGSFVSIGRACLSEAFVTAHAPRPAETTCPAAPVGVPVLEANFEDGDLEGFVNQGNSNVTVEIDATTGANATTHSLKIRGGSAFRSGVTHTFASIKPSYIGYYMKLETVDTRFTGYFVFKSDASNSSLGGVVAQYDSLTAFEGRVEVPVTPGKWLHIELRNIDWSERTFDLYVDCVRAAEDLPIPSDVGDAIDRLDLFNNLRDTTATPAVWFDEIVIR